MKNIYIPAEAKFEGSNGLYYRICLEKDCFQYFDFTNEEWKCTNNNPFVRLISGEKPAEFWPVADDIEMVPTSYAELLEIELEKTLIEIELIKGKKKCEAKEIANKKFDQIIESISNEYFWNE